MSSKRVTLFVTLAIVLILVISACAPAATPTPTPTKPAAAPTKVPEATKPVPAATKAPEATKPAAEAAKPAVGTLPKSVTLATFSPGSVYNAVGVGLAKVASDAGPIQVIAQPYTGAPAYIPQLASTGKPEVGVLAALEAWQAFTGKATAGPPPEGITVPIPYSQAFTKLRALMFGTDNMVSMLVRKDSKYQSLNDLKGARVAWGFKGQAAPALGNYTVATLGGLNPSNVKTVEVANVVSGVRALQEGRVDAVFIGLGMGAIAEADAQVGVRILDIPRDSPYLKVAQGMMPGGRIDKVKAGTSAGVVKDTDMWGYPAVVMASTNIPDNVAYTLVKVWWDNYQKLKPMYVMFEGWTPDIYVSKTATIPYHSGAIAFYKEKGVWTAELDQNQPQLLKGELPFVK